MSHHGSPPPTGHHESLDVSRPDGHNSLLREHDCNPFGLVAQKGVVARIRKMGVDSVDYHRATVLGRADDHAGRALGYYASRGETPLEWGGQLAGRLGLSGQVNDGSYEALFGPAAPVTHTWGHGWCRRGAQAWS